MFVTTTCLGFYPAFRRDEIKAALLEQLIADCRFRGAILHAYCVMDNHIHLLLRSPLDREMSWFMQRFKTHASTLILPKLGVYERHALARHEDREGHKLWKRSFRGIAIRDERMFWACIRYIHLNPLRAGICARTLDYAWSSARLFEECKWQEETGIMEAVLG
jgi:putative transposase